MKKANEDAMKRGPRIVPEAVKSTSRSFLSPDPTKIGTERRKLKRVASSRENPANSPPEIVAPERDIPGTSARL